jgi:predicted aspartyl protease/Flp pilus assembly protein TadD
MELAVHMDGARPIVTVGLNGTPVPLLLDTGAFFSMLPMSTARQLNLPLRSVPFGLLVSGHTGDVDVRRTTVKNVQFLGTEIHDVEFLVGGNELGQGIMGILGRNFLALGDTEFDLAHGVVRIVIPKGDCKDLNMAYWAGEAPVNVLPMIDNFSTRDSSIKVAVNVNGHRVVALLDTGATTVLKLRAPHRAGIEDAQLTPMGRKGGAGEGHTATWTAKVAKIAIGGEAITNSTLEVDDADDDLDMLLGIDWFLSHRIYISRGQDKIYATWNGGAVFLHDRNSKIDPQDAVRYAAPPEAAAASDADALSRSGQAAASRGDFNAALADLDRACALAPSDATCFAARAKVHLALKQPEPALADIEQALRLNPADAPTRLLRATVRFHALKDRAGALDDLQSLDQALPNESHLRAALGEFYANLDMTPQALRQWDLWMSTHLEDAARGQVLNQRCWLRVRMNVDLDRALEDCRAAVSEDGDNGAYHDSLGWVWLRSGRPAKAVDEFDKAISLRARSPWSLYGRALAKAARGDVPGSEGDFAAARTFDRHIDDEVRRAGLPTGPGAKLVTPLRLRRAHLLGRRPARGGVLPAAKWLAFRVVAVPNVSGLSPHCTKGA